ncbi:DUF7662 domain-containing protein [Rummeliibacillus sp. JY-2-4R]
MASHTLQGKYLPLYEYLSKQQEKRIILSFEKIEEILHAKLPKSAYKYQAWWGNTRSGTYVQAAAWLEAEFRVDFVQFGRCVEFIKVSKDILTKKKNKVVRESQNPKMKPVEETMYTKMELSHKINKKMDRIQQFFAANNTRQFAKESSISQLEVLRECRRLFSGIEQDLNYLAILLMQEYLDKRHQLELINPCIKQLDLHTYFYEKHTVGEEIAAILKTASVEVTDDYITSQRTMFLKECRVLNQSKATIQYYFVIEENAYNIIEKNYKQYLGNIRLILLPKVIKGKLTLRV